MNRIIFLFTVLAIINPSVIYTQTIPFHHYDSKDGLSSSNVFSMVQDKTGYIWFATKAGVSKFDAHSFESYNSNNGLISNDIINVALGSDSSIYFVTSDKGIFKFRNNIIEKYNINNTEYLAPYGIVMRNDTIYTYSFNYLHSIHNHDLTKFYSTQYSLHGNFPDNLLLHSLSNTTMGIIAATSEGLYALRDNKFEKIITDWLQD
ncbi:MAG: hypothetical protein EHM58_00370, partial [Ignavibacteriae bacterium]